MKKTMGDRSFMVAAPVLWNSLPLSVRQGKDIDDFMRSVKAFVKILSKMVQIRLQI